MRKYRAAPAELPPYWRSFDAVIDRSFGGNETAWAYAMAGHLGHSVDGILANYRGAPEAPQKEQPAP